MLKWKVKTQITDTDVAESAKGVIRWDLKESKFMLAVSCAAWQEDSYDYNKPASDINRFFV